MCVKPGVRLSLFLLVPLASACNSYDLDNKIRCAIGGNCAGGNQIANFTFDATVNQLAKSYSGAISGDTITVSLPYAILSSAIPSFTTTAVSVKIGTISQISGVTPVNFVGPVTYTIMGADGAIRTMTVHVTPIIPVLDTGQTTCYDSGAVTACPVVGHARQDADFLALPNGRSFVGPTAHPVYTADYTTRDMASGLLYKTCVEGLTGVACVGGTVATPGWAVASTTTCSALNGLNSGAGYAGRTNWRMPTVNEYANLVDYQVAAPTISLASFPATPNSQQWTGTINAPNTANAWTINFTSGALSSASAVGSPYSTRCVSGDGVPPQNFVSNGDGTITDTRTNLRWQQSANIDQTWQVALTACASLSLAAKAWRLPNKNELRSLVDFFNTGAPVINTAAFPGTTASAHWSSTTHGTAGPAYAWHFDFSNGNSNSSLKSTTYPFRCVTDGP